MSRKKGLRGAAAGLAAAFFCCLAADAAAGEYDFKVPFNGDFDTAHEEAFGRLVDSLSGGGADPASVNADIDAIIASEDFTEDGSLIVSFSPDAVKRLLGSGRIAVWKGLEEPLLIWMIRGTTADVAGDDGQVDSRSEVRIVSSGEKDGFADALIAAGLREKVRAILPLNDLDDMEKVSVSDIMQGAADRIAAASAKYTGGAAAALLLTGTPGNLSLTYHIVDLAKGETVYSDTAEGETSAVVGEFYASLKNVFGRKNPSAAGLGAGSGDPGAAPLLDGYDGTEPSLNLGSRPDGSYVVLIKGTPGFDAMMDIKRNFYKAGFSEAEITDVKGGDVVFTLTAIKNVDPRGLMELYPALVPDGAVPDVFNFDATVKNAIVIPDEKAEQTAENAGEGDGGATAAQPEEKPAATDAAAGPAGEKAAEPVTGTRDVRRGRRKHRGSFLDPNRRYKTGGGVL